MANLERLINLVNEVKKANVELHNAFLEEGYEEKHTGTYEDVEEWYVHKTIAGKINGNTSSSQEWFETAIETGLIFRKMH